VVWTRSTEAAGRSVAPSTTLAAAYP